VGEESHGKLALLCVSKPRKAPSQRENPKEEEQKNTVASHHGRVNLRSGWDVAHLNFWQSTSRKSGKFGKNFLISKQIQSLEKMKFPCSRIAIADGLSKA